MSIGPIEKAMQIRANWPYRVRVPAAAQAKRVRSAQDLMFAVEPEKTMSDSCRREARCNFVLATVAGFEIYWRETFRLLINRNPHAMQTWKATSQVTFRMSEVGAILGKKLSLGELVACSQTFQHPEAINRLASDILGCDFFARFKSEFEITMQAANKKDRSLFKPWHVTGAGVFKDHFPIVIECLELRHALAHDLPNTERVTFAAVMQYAGAISIWNLFLGTALDSWTSDAQADDTPPRPAPQSHRARRKGHVNGGEHGLRKGSQARAPMEHLRCPKP